MSGCENGAEMPKIPLDRVSQKRDRGRPPTVRPSEIRGRADNYRFIFGQVWDRLWPRLSFQNPVGTTVNASARFYEGLTLPGSFWPHSPGTTAGILPATAINPNLPTSNATAPVDRTWVAPAP